MEVAFGSLSVATFQRQLGKLAFSQLIEATNGFPSASMIESGGFGEVCKATLNDGSSVTINGEFTMEMETLGKINHRNLIPLLGYCKVSIERLLGYEYMRYRSLEDMLHRRLQEQETALDCDERNEMIPVYEYMEKGTLKSHMYNSDLLNLRSRGLKHSRGLHYLHTGFAMAIIHRDVNCQIYKYPA